MGETTAVLDEAFDRLEGASFELPNGFVNHGAMACEALDALGLDDWIDTWARHAVALGGVSVVPRPPARVTDLGPEGALGDYARLPEWIGWFRRQLEADGWATVVHRWVPRLTPGLGVALFHCMIRTAHAVRAIEEADSPARRAELARALGYWAARYRPGPVIAIPRAGGAPGEVPPGGLQIAARAARAYLRRPDILHLHGVTGAMALELLTPHLSAGAAERAVRQLTADHRALYGADRRDPASDPGLVLASSEGSGRWSSALVAHEAAASGDPHQVKLVEACVRGLAATGDQAFAAAASAVVGHDGGGDRGPRDRSRQPAAG